MKAGQRQYLLGLGSNLGDRAYYIEQAVMALAALPETQILAISEAFDSDPVGFKEQDNFLNICLAVTCEFNPEELLATCLSIETKLGRVRTIKDGPRTIDIDVLFYEGGAVELPDLTLPHPRAAERAFVLVPWLDLDASATLPGFGAIAGLSLVRDVLGVRRLGPDRCLRLPM